MRSPHSPPVCRIQAGFGQGRFPGPPITPLRRHPSSLDTGSRYHTHHNSHGHFVSGGYMLKLSSDPSGLRRPVPSAPVFPCTPPSFRNGSAGLHVVKGSTVARSPSVGLITHIRVGRVSRFSCKCSIPGWPVPMSPKSSMPLLCDPKRVAYGQEWGRRRYHNPQRPVVAAPASLNARGFSSLFSWQRKTSNHPVRWHRVAGVAAPDTVQCWQVSHPVLAVHECLSV